MHRQHEPADSFGQYRHNLDSIATMRCTAGLASSPSSGREAPPREALKELFCFC
jgi:hypothetical protein